MDGGLGTGMRGVQGKLPEGLEGPQRPVLLQDLLGTVPCSHFAIFLQDLPEEVMSIDDHFEGVCSNTALAGRLTDHQQFFGGGSNSTPGIPCN